MAVTINSNLSSLRAQRLLARATDSLSNVFQRLSSGQRINKASDDAAGLAISESLALKNRVYTQAIRNAGDGVSLLSVAEGALSQLSNIVVRQRELSEQASNGVLASRQRNALQKEANSLVNEYNRIVDSTSFNGLGLLDGTLAPSGLGLQLGFGSAESLLIYLNRDFGHPAGSGTFGSPVSVADLTQVQVNALSDPQAIDFNGDGNLDLLYTGQNYGFAFQFGNGDGTFLNPRTITVSPSGDGTVVIAGDLNRDGKPDVVAVTNPNPSPGPSNVVIYLGNGDGTFSIGSSILNGTGNTSIGPLYLHDLDGDGRLDLIAPNASHHDLMVYKGNGDGSFRAASTFLKNNATGNVTPALGDFNGDGILDVLAVNGPGTFGVYLGNGDLTFNSSITTYDGKNVSSQAVGDFDGDGILDFTIYESNTGGNLLMFHGNGDGTFKTATVTSTAFGAGGGGTMKTKDINGDGLDDLVAIIDGTVITYFGSYNGTFTASQSQLLNRYNGVVADFNGDGIDDLVAANAGYPTPPTSSLGVADPNRWAEKMRRLDFTSPLYARQELSYLRSISNRVSKELGTIGAAQGRLQAAQSLLETTRQNETEARSRIVDADTADDSAQLTRTQILQQACAAVLSQANLQPRLALALLRQ